MGMEYGVETRVVLMRITSNGYNYDRCSMERFSEIILSVLLIEFCNVILMGNITLFELHLEN